MTQYTQYSEPQHVNIGAAANDGTGDNIRAGAIKINNNFVDLYQAVNSIPTYTLPAATSSILGGVMVDGSSIVVNNGVISAQMLSPANVIPLKDGVAAIGTSLRYARQDHVHPISIPSGIIAMWSGSVASIPSGWVLCDGTNGTPDLRSKFVIGAGSSYSVSSVGGSADAIVPAHSHTATSTFTGQPLGSHTHGITDPGHTHSYSTYTSFLPQSGSATQCWTGSSTATTGSSTTGITIQASTAGTPTGSVTTSISSYGSSATGANLPPYYALAFIMKS